MSIANPFLYDKDRDVTGSEKKQKLLKWVTIASVTVALTLIITKLIAYFMTDSVSLLASLADSTIDAVASLITFISVRHASEPADKEHRYGHGKLEALSAIMQAMFIMGSALFLVYEALHHLFIPKIIHATEIGVSVTVFAILITLALIFFQKFVIKRTNSIAIEADLMHYKGDLLMNAGVIAALLLVKWTGWPYFDPLFAFLIAGFLVYSAFQVGQDSFHILMDKELPEQDRQTIIKHVKAHSKAKNIHDLRTRTTGIHIFIEFHLELDGNLTLNEAHDITEDIELILYKAFPNSEIIIHQEPAGIIDDRLDDRL